MCINNHFGIHIEGISGPIMDSKVHRYLKVKESNLYREMQNGQICT